MLIIYSLLLTLTSSSAQGSAAAAPTAPSACSTVDLRNDPRLPPAKYQGSSAWCFAYAMATVAGFDLHEPISALSFVMAPAWTSGLNGTESLKRGLSEKQMPQVFNEAQNWGFCREKDLPSDVREKGFPDLTQVYSMIATGPLPPACAYSESDSIDQTRFMNMSFPLANLSDILHASYGNSSDEAVLFELGEKSCKQNRFTPKDKLSFHWLAPKESGIAALNELLDKKQPAGVNYRTKPVLKSASDFGHSSTILGRRFRNGKCEYLIRDPYGPATFSRRPNKSGDVYVPEADLLKGNPSLWSIDSSPPNSD